MRSGLLNCNKIESVGMAARRGLNFVWGPTKYVRIFIVVMWYKMIRIHDKYNFSS